MREGGGAGPAPGPLCGGRGRGLVNFKAKDEGNVWRWCLLVLRGGRGREYGRERGACFDWKFGDNIDISVEATIAPSEEVAEEVGAQNRARIGAPDVAKPGYGTKGWRGYQDVGFGISDELRDNVLVHGPEGGMSC